ncbi:MAG: condensation domain-containing protein [Bacteroidota bacterium]
MKKDFIHKLLSQNIHLRVEGGNLKVNAPKGVLTPELLDEIKTNKPYLTKLLSSRTKIPKLELADHYPVSPAQNRMWVLSKFAKESAAFTISSKWEFHGTLDRDHLQKAFEILVDRHESLRTYFKTNEEDQLRQWIVPSKAVKFTIDFHEIAASDAIGLNTVIKKHNDYTFDLSNAPLLKVELVKINDARHLLMFSIHHIIGDGWSLEVLSKELIQVYNSLCMGVPIAMQKLSIQYKDYTAWLESKEQQHILAQSLDFWKAKLKGELPILDLPMAKKRPPIKTYNGALVDHTFSSGFTGALRSIIKGEEASLFMGIIASINGLLYRYTHKTDIVLGTGVSGREHSDLVGQVGLYLNTLAIRTQFEPTIGFSELLSLQKAILLEAYNHQSCPFNDVVDALQLDRDISRSALFDIMVVLQNQQDLLGDSNTTFSGVRVQPFKETVNETSQFDISFSFVENENGLAVSTTFNTDIYSEEFIIRLLTHLENFVIEVVENPKKPISLIDYLEPEEKRELIEGFNATEIAYAKNGNVVELIESRVKEVPNEIALVYAETSLSYHQLNVRAEQLAHYLLQEGVDKNAVIAICTDRSLEMVVAILGVLKIGAAYLPLDPSYPLERLDYIIEDSGAQWILSKEEISGFLPKSKTIVCLENEAIWKTYTEKIETKANERAYLIYTSGTTGRPKGVEVSHRNLMNFFAGLNAHFGATGKTETWLAVTSMSFDISILELLWTLTRGSKVVIHPDRPAVLDHLNEDELTALRQLSNEAFNDPLQQESKDAMVWRNKVQYDFLLKRMANVVTTPQLMKSHVITHFQTTPSFIQELLLDEEGRAALKHIDTLLIGGEALSETICNSLLDLREKSIFNMYGPTETTIWSTVKEITDKGAITIGKPIANTQVYVMDINKQLCPVGVIGELCIGGDGVALGYRRKDDLNALKFVENPFSTTKTAGKIYRTGDLARWLPNGELECLGRIDNQVKLRGHRIELGEIENVLRSGKGVIDAAADVSTTEMGEKVLIAYIASEEKLIVNELRGFLLRYIPQYMIPTQFVLVEKLPLTLNGKLDRKSLSELNDGTGIASMELVAPSNKIEEQLEAIWKEILGTDAIGVTNDFFHMGGHSLKAVRMLSKVNKEFQINIDIPSVFELRTIAEMANLIQNIQWDQQQVKVNKVVDRISI